MGEWNEAWESFHQLLKSHPGIEVETSQIQQTLTRAPPGRSESLARGYERNASPVPDLP